MEIPEDLVKQIVRRNCVVLVGAGLSVGAGLPKWHQLLQQMVDWSESHGVSLRNKEDIERAIAEWKLLFAAQVLRDQMGDDKFREFMSEVFHRPDLKPTEAHLLLPQMPFAAAITTNYDMLVESGYTVIHKKKDFDVFTQVDLAQLSTALHRGEFFVLKAHGTVERFETIVLGRGDYRTLMFASPGYRIFLHSLFITRTVLFLGFSLTDPDLLYLLDEMQAAYAGHSVTHYALMDETKLSPTERDGYANDFGIQIIPYTPSAPNHPEVKLFLTELIEKHLPKQSVLHTLEEARKILDDDDPHFRVVFNTKGEFTIEEKYPGAFEEHPISLSTKVQFDTTTPEGREAHEQWRRAWATGETVIIESPHLVSFTPPEIVSRYVDIPTESMQLTIGQRLGSRTLPIKVIIECDGGETRTLDYILLEVKQSGEEQMTLTNERQQVPWKVEQIIKFNSNQSTFNLRFNDTGLNVKQALDGLRFSNALSRGGTLRIESLETGFQLAHTPLAPGAFQSPDLRLIELLEQLVFIQSKTAILFTSPDTVSREDAQAIFATAQILRTGHGELNPEEPIVINLTVEQAREAFKKFDGGATVSVSHFQDDLTANILGVKVSLGPVLLTCKQAHVTKEDLETLRANIEAISPEGIIHIPTTPFENSPWEARFLNWLPADEAAAVRSLPFMRMIALKGFVRVHYEALKQEQGSNVDALVKRIADTWEKTSEKGSVGNPVAGSTPEELRVALQPVTAEMDQGTRFNFAAKLFERCVLSSGKAAKLAGMDRVTFLTSLHQVGIAVLDLDKEDMENEARYAGIK